MRLFIAVLMAALLGSVLSAPAVAHPLGNFTINHLAKVRPDARGLSLRYIIDMAEIPTFQVMRERSIEGSERGARLKQWAHDEIPAITSGLDVRVDGQRIALTTTEPKVSTRPGAGGLPTLYFVDEFRAQFARPGRTHAIAIDDHLYEGRIGWKDIVVAPETEPTHELRAYPNALLGSPRAITRLDLRLSTTGRVLSYHSSGAQLATPAGSASQLRSNLLSDMLAKGAANPLFVLITLLVAVGLGALHALEPGHGKTLLAVSLVGARATPKQAFILASALTLAHTAGVIALGIVLLALAQWIVPENIYPWITLVSGIFVAALGALALSRYVKTRRGLAHQHKHAHHPVQHHDHGYGHSHAHVVPGDAPLSFKSVVLVAMSGNIAPCPAALVVLLTALTLHQVGYGLIVVVAFSIGLAAVLTGLGIAVVHGASWLSNRRGFDRWITYGPLVTAIMICLIGVVMLGKASAAALQAPAIPVAVLALAAIAGYALSPGHVHTEGHAQARAAAAPPLEREST